MWAPSASGAVSSASATVEAVEAAAELEELGYGALWIPGGAGGAVLDAGADHVCLRVVTNALERLPRAEWRALAGAVFTVA